MPKDAFLDGIDRRLLMLLQKDNRLTNHELGQMVNLSTSAVNERVRKLISEKVITGHHVRVDPKKINLGIGVYIFTAIDAPENNANFLKKMETLSQVLECHHITGEYSFLIKAQVRDTDHLEQLITNGIKSVKGVTKTQTSLILSSPISLAIIDCLDVNNGLIKGK